MDVASKMKMNRLKRFVIRVEKNLRIKEKIGEGYLGNMW